MTQYTVVKVYNNACPKTKYKTQKKVKKKKFKLVQNRDLFEENINTEILFLVEEQRKKRLFFVRFGRSFPHWTNKTNKKSHTRSCPVLYLHPLLSSIFPTRTKTETLILIPQPRYSSIFLPIFSAAFFRFPQSETSSLFGFALWKRRIAVVVENRLRRVLKRLRFYFWRNFVGGVAEARVSLHLFLSL